MVQNAQRTRPIIFTKSPRVDPTEPTLELLEASADSSMFIRLSENFESTQTDDMQVFIIKLGKLTLGCSLVCSVLTTSWGGFLHAELQRRAATPHA